METIDHLAARLERLEQENRCLKRSCYAGILAMGGLLALGFMNQDRANAPPGGNVVLKDADGNNRGSLDIRQDGIRVLFGDGKASGSALLLGSGTAVLKTYDGNGEPISGIALGETGVIVAARSAKGTLVGANALSNDTGNLLKSEKPPSAQRQR